MFHAFNSRDSIEFPGALNANVYSPACVSAMVSLKIGKHSPLVRGPKCSKRVDRISPILVDSSVPCCLPSLLEFSLVPPAPVSLSGPAPLMRFTDSQVSKDWLLAITINHMAKTRASRRL